MIERTLHRLRKDLEAVESVAHSLEGPSRDSLSAALRGLRGSLDALSEDSDGQAVPDAAQATPHELRLRRHRRMRSLAARSTMLVRMMDAEANCRWVNRAWLAHTGRSRAQTRAAGWLQDVHPGDRQNCTDAGDDQEPARSFRPLEYRLRSASGDYAWVLELRTPRLAADGRVAGYLCAALDVGQQREAAAGLALQAAVARVLARSGSGDQALVPILRLVCEHLSWDEAELWSADTISTCLARWPAIATEPDTAASFSSDPGSEAATHARRAWLRVPVELHGRSWGSLRVQGWAGCSGGRAAGDALRAAAAQLGHCRERQWLAERLRVPMQADVQVLDSMRDALIAVDRFGHVLEINRAAQLQFGRARAGVLGAHIKDMGLPAWVESEVLRTIVVHAAERPAPADDSPTPKLDTASAAPTGKSQPLSIYVCETEELGHLGVVDLAYQSRLKSMTSELLLAEENERRQLAADLHDGLGQLLALIAFKITSLRPSADQALAGALDDVADLVAQANGAARSISFELSPPILHDLGLEPALQWLAENIEERYDIHIDLHIDGRPKPTDERTRILLFRSVRELLINAAKHSGTKDVQVIVEREDDFLNIAVSDAGVGMESRAERPSGYGLMSMNERIQHLGGTMSIFSVPGRGVRVHLSAPIVTTDSNGTGAAR